MISAFALATLPLLMHTHTHTYLLVDGTSAYDPSHYAGLLSEQEPSNIITSVIITRPARVGNVGGGWKIRLDWVETGE